MKKLIATTALLLIIPMIACAQNHSRRHWGQAYAFVGEGADSFDGGTLGVINAGGGAEVLVVKGLALGGEIGYMEYNRVNSPGKWGVFSIDPSYHFFSRSPESRFVPFVECGYTGKPNRYPTYQTSLFNFGAGFHYWGAKRVGMRLEFRDHYLPGPLGHAEHFWGLRIGLAFR